MALELIGSTPNQLQEPSDPELLLPELTTKQIDLHHPVANYNMNT